MTIRQYKKKETRNLRKSANQGKRKKRATLKKKRGG